MKIDDGTGSGVSAKVDKANRLLTLSVSEGLNIEAAGLGDNYNINTGVVNLTTGNKSAVAYMKNNDDNEFVLEKVLVILGTSTGGAGDTLVELVKNPTAGTLISGAVDVDIKENRNFGSSKTLDGDCFKGAEGNTFTDGTLFASSTRSGATVLPFEADVIILPKAASIGVDVTPAAGNTSQNIIVAFIGFLFDKDAI